MKSLHSPLTPFRIVGVCALFAVLAACGSGGGGGDSSPVAVADTYASATGQISITVSAPGVLANDSGTGLTAELLDPPANHAGTFTLNANGSFTYTLRTTSTATTDSFTYRARNGTNTSGLATVTISITPPVARDDSFSVNQGDSVNGSVLTHGTPDTPASGVTVELVPDSGPQYHNGPAFSIDPTTGAFTYQHNGAGAIVDSFRYRTKIGAIHSNEATVTININQPPVASNSCPAITDGTTSLPVNLATSVSDPNGVGPFIFTIATQPSNGMVTPAQSTTGQFTYTPNIPSGNVGRRGMDRFTFTVTDSGGQTSPPATVWILNGGNVRIMPLGDSITEGVTDGANDKPDPGYRVGYRKKLFDDLVALGYPIDFVGTQSEGANASLADTQHEGHPGWRDDEILNGTSEPDKQLSCAPLPSNCKLSNWLDLAAPDIILLHIGTNGMNNVGADTSATDVAGILDRVKAWQSANGWSAHVFVAEIIGSTDTVTTNPNITTFNANVSAMVKARIQTGDRLTWVPRASLNYQVGPADGNPAGPDMADFVHPNDDGYAKMADRWKSELLNSAILPTCP